MLDLFGLPPSENADIQIFTRLTTVDGLQWMTWLKPRGVTMTIALAIGGGSGGGGGFTGIAGSGRGGGGAGGSSGIARVIIPAIFLPDSLYVQVGGGGVGGAADAAGGAGLTLSYISVAPNATPAYNILLRSGNAVATGGGAGTATAGGAGGAASTITSLTNMPLAGYGQFNSIAGQAGTAGGDDLGADGTAITIPVTGVLVQGGSGGAGTTSADFAGGACTAITNSYLSQQRPATPAAGSFDGSGGVQLWKPFFSFGGLGGSSSNTGIGGNGGNGAYGAGGGGGGGGTTGGKGGDGGSGIVIICCW